MPQTTPAPIPRSARLVLAIAFVLAAAGIVNLTVDGVDAGQSREELTNLSDTFAEIAEEASPWVVYIEVKRDIPIRRSPNMRGQQFDNPQDFQDFFDRFFSDPRFRGPRQAPPDDAPGPHRRVPAGQGSGFIISEDGYIVTNHHVVGNADEVSVTLHDGRTFDAKIVGSDERTEIALIKVDATGLPYARLGDSDEVRVGEWVLAIGSPFGLTHTVTSGIISAQGRGNVAIADYSDFIQTDAAINPGNSGGPLVNLDGEVIGVNTAIYSRTGGYQGIGFTIPINMVKFVRDQLVEYGTITRGFLGIIIQGVDAETAEWFDVPDGQGILVAEVTPGSPAEEAGLKRDDIIIEYDTKPVGDIGSFRSRVSTTPAGTEVSMVIMRDGKRLNKTVKIGGQEPDELKVASRGAAEEGFGFSVENLTPQTAQQFGLEGVSGVVVSEVLPGSEAAMSGLQPGVVIQSVNRKEVGNVNEFNEALSDTGGRKSILLYVLRPDGSRMYVTISKN